MTVTTEFLKTLSEDIIQNRKYIKELLETQNKILKRLDKYDASSENHEVNK